MKCAGLSGTYTQVPVDGWDETENGCTSLVDSGCYIPENPASILNEESIITDIND